MADIRDERRALAFVDRAFEQLSTKLLSGRPGPPTDSLAGLFAQAAGERSITTIQVLRPYLASLSHHLDAQKAAAKGLIIRAMGDPDPQKALAAANRTIRDRVNRVIETESTALRNAGLLVRADRAAANMGIADPTVVFISRPTCCVECRRLHRTDQDDPRAWLRSELGTSYHRRGDEFPKIGGLHPNCRCTCVFVPPGYGFRDGKLTYVAADFLLLADQRG